MRCRPGGVAVVAFESGAIPETLGAGGILLKDKKPRSVADALMAAFGDPQTIGRLKLAQQHELTRFAPALFERRWAEALQGIGIKV